MQLTKFSTAVYLAACATAVGFSFAALPAKAATQSDVVKATASQRCVQLADYAADVAEMRDLGMSLADIKEINGERFRNNVLDAHNMAAEMTYQHGDLPPRQVRAGLLSGCMAAVNEEAARRKL